MSPPSARPALDFTKSYWSLSSFFLCLRRHRIILPVNVLSHHDNPSESEGPQAGQWVNERDLQPWCVFLIRLAPPYLLSLLDWRVYCRRDMRSSSALPTLWITASSGYVPRRHHAPDPANTTGAMLPSFPLLRHLARSIDVPEVACTNSRRTKRVGDAQIAAAEVNDLRCVILFRSAFFLFFPFLCDPPF
ncbi:hypothetical protein B0H16DRAFT_256992 [Mycena metata]|uniref:Uncharacterized protein n=1 Tax=Mycena metata TaxID=1033252 RepID=A0AAD7MSQ2_9AGAR|nr:hypothetical protein B0H16DRAFT_202664 [Mycena metata]KAJ7769534.1 hypothetical protein B0H16DRAFT_256992 [Mycena metata]